MRVIDLLQELAPQHQVAVIEDQVLHIDITGKETEAVVGSLVQVNERIIIHARPQRGISVQILVPDHGKGGIHAPVDQVIHLQREVFIYIVIVLPVKIAELVGGMQRSGDFHRSEDRFRCGGSHRIGRRLLHRLFSRPGHGAEQSLDATYQDQGENRHPSPPYDSSTHSLPNCMVSTVHHHSMPVRNEKINSRSPASRGESLPNFPAACGIIDPQAASSQPLTSCLTFCRSHL